MQALTYVTLLLLCFDKLVGPKIYIGRHTTISSTANSPYKRYILSSSKEKIPKTTSAWQTFTNYISLFSPFCHVIGHFHGWKRPNEHDRALQGSKTVPHQAKVASHFSKSYYYTSLHNTWCKQRHHKWINQEPCDSAFAKCLAQC